MIILSHVNKTYPGEKRPALVDVNLTLPDTGLVFLFGPSGAGKTTLASLIGGMDDDFEGVIQAYGQKLEDLSGDELSDYRLRNVGFSFQNGFLEEENSVFEEVTKPLAIYGLPKVRLEECCRRNLELFGISGFEKRKIKELSGGERKRVSLARASIKDSPLLIYDEPTAGLNASLAQKVFDALVEKAQEALVIVITHDSQFLPLGAVVNLKDGKIVGSTLTVSPQFEQKPRPVEERTEKKRLLSLLSYSFKNFCRSLKKTSIACFVMAIAVTVAGFSILLISGVGNGVEGMIGSSMDSLSVLVQPEEDENAENARNLYLSAEDVEEMASLDPTSVIGSGGCYVKGVNDKFTPQSGFRICIGDWRYPRSFGLDLLSEASFASNREDFVPFGSYVPEELRMDEIYLGAPIQMLNSLSEIVCGEVDYDELAKAGENSEVYLAVTASIPEASGVKEKTIYVRNFFISDEVELIHSSPDFASRFFEEKLGMEYSYDLYSLDPIPYTLKKAGVVWVLKEKLGSFYRQFQLAEEYSDYALAKLEGKEKERAVPIAVTYRKGKEASPRDAVNIYMKYPNAIRSYSLSSPVYTYVFSGLYEGFSAPLFLSVNKESLNTVIDHNAVTEFNISAYSFADGELPDDVYSSSLADSMLGEGIGFAQPQDSLLVKGVFPADDDSIALSQGLARKIFGQPEKALNRTFNLLMLDSVQKTETGYQNHFMEASLKIVGLMDDEEDKIYHDAFFPMALAFAHSQMNPQYLTCDAFILRFKSQEQLEGLLDKLKDSYPQYRFTTPMKDMLDALDSSLTSIGAGLAAFAALAVVLAALLFSLNLYLAIRKSERRVGDMLCVGYKGKEVRFFFIFQALGMSLLAALESFIGLFFAEKMVVKELSTLFDGYTPENAAVPYFVVLALALLVGLVIALPVSARVKKISPIKAFRLH